MVTLNPLAALIQGSGTNTIAQSAGTNSEGFSKLLKDAIKSTVNDQRAAEKMTFKAASGQDVPMHEVIQAVGKAEMTLQTMITVRDRAIEAYQEIIRMPI